MFATPPLPEPMPYRTDAPGIAWRIDFILAGLLAIIGLHQHRLGPLAALLWTRLSRTRQRFARLFAHLAAGHAPRRRGGVCRPGASVPSLRRRSGWLAVLLDYNARNLASQLDHLLRDPGVAQAIAASPGAARTMRPLCRMLGVALPEPLALPPRLLTPRPTPPPRPPKPLRPPAMRPPDLKLPAYIRAAARAWRRPGEKIT